MNQDGTTTSLRPYLQFDGLRYTGVTILMDVSITHIMGLAANHASQPRPRHETGDWEEQQVQGRGRSAALDNN